MTRKRRKPSPSKDGCEIEELIAQLEADLEKVEDVEFRETVKKVIQELRAENDFLDKVERSL